MENATIEPLQRMFAKINQMPSLRRLTLYCTNPLGQLELPIVAQLSEFYSFTSTKESSKITDTLIKYGENNLNLKRIGTGTKIDDKLLSNQFLVSKIVHLTLNLASESIDRLSNILLRLSNLCSLTVTWLAHTPLVELIGALVPVTSDHSKLNTLKLIVVAADEFHDIDYDTSPLDLSVLVHKDQSLRSINTLELYFSTLSHENYGLFQFESIFPNVNSITLRSNCVSCSICGYGLVGYIFEMWWFRRKRTKCIKLMLQCFQQMKQKPQINFYYFSVIPFTWIQFK